LANANRLPTGQAKDLIFYKIAANKATSPVFCNKKNADNKINPHIS
jgi:hypothetical protein